MIIEILNIQKDQAKLDYLIKIAKIKGIQADTIKDKMFTLVDEDEEAV